LTGILLVAIRMKWPVRLVKLFGRGESSSERLLVTAGISRHGLPSANPSPFFVNGATRHSPLVLLGVRINRGFAGKNNAP
jgi:hypothetical protein